MVIEALVSVIIISLISLIGVFFLPFKKASLYLVSLAAGALLGDVFLHLLPEINLNLKASLFILLGFLIFFIIEKIIHWKNCQINDHNHCQHKPLATMNLIGDALHNFLDGLIIISSYMVSVPLGIASSVAIIFHEIPQEIGDFGVLIHAGIEKNKAILLNFLVALTAILGVILGLALNLKDYLLPLAAGGFIYISGVDLIPELHQEKKIKQSLIQLIIFILGVLIMLALRIYGA